MGGYQYEKKKVELIQVEVKGILTTSKECTKCCSVKPLCEYNFKSNGLGQTESRCKLCLREYRQKRKAEKAEYDKAYREENRERLLEKSRKWHRDNRGASNEDRKRRYYDNHEAEKEYRRIYHRENKVNLREYKRIYYLENIERIREYRRLNRDKIRRYDRDYYENNKGRYAKWWRDYYNENKEELATKNKKYYEENREMYSERYKRYYRTPRGQEASKLSRHRRRIRVKGCINTLTDTQWENSKKHFEYKCAYCLSESKLTVDHFVPVAQGGELSIKNVIPACSSCNSSKKDRNFSDWYKGQDFYNEKQESMILKYLGYEDNNSQQIAMF